MSTSAESDRRMRWRVWSMNWSSAPMRMGSGIVTSVPPVSQTAWMAVMSERVVGPSSATCEPGPIPRSCRTAAAARASACSCAQEIVS